MDAFAKSTSIAILIVIILFAVLAAWYLKANSFARETVEVVFPAFGAILLSLYLGYKTVALDRPPPKRFGTTVAILHDAARGKVSGMVPWSWSHSLKTGEFEGVREIDFIAGNTKFTGIPIVERLRDIKLPPPSPAEEMIRDIVQFAICEWLQNPENSPGYLPQRTIELIGGIGGKAGSQAESVDWIRIHSTDNPLLAAQPISLLLPPHSRAWADSKPIRSLVIQTRHSIVSVRILGHSSVALNLSDGLDAERIYAALNLPKDSQHLRIWGFDVDVIADQRPFTRFSTEAKVEAKWFDRLERNLDVAFSWDRLHSLYTHD